MGSILKFLRVLIGMGLLVGCGDDYPVQPESAGELIEEMVQVPAGEFVMGTNEYGRDEGPAHVVFLDAFWIDRFEVVNVDYRLFVATTGHDPSACADSVGFNAARQPVVGVTWFDAQDFCAWAGKRLCSEAEWEKAAGGDGRIYPWGNEDPDPTRLNFNGHVGKPATVGSFPEGMSPFEVSDLSGNVWEWVADWYRVAYYRNSPRQNPQGPESGGLRVMRGGSWVNGAPAVRVQERGRLNPIWQGKEIGFRCCR